MPREKLDLATIFSTVTQSLAANQSSLNQADTFNRDHGNNMVQTFQIITDALKQKQGTSHSQALAYASKAILKNSSSGSGKMYAQNLARASTQFKGKSIDAEGALSLLQTLIGSSQSNQTGSQQGSGDPLSGLLSNLAGGGNPQAQAGSGDLLGGLLGNLVGGAAPTSSGAAQPAGNNLLGSLVGSLLGGTSGAGAGGGGGIGQLVEAFLGDSGMGNATHRKDSTQLVINAFLQALNGLKK